MTIFRELGNALMIAVWSAMVFNVIALNERHLRHLLKSYQKYYNETRTHLSLQNDTPISRASKPSVRR